MGWVVTLHSVWRWVVLLLGVGAIVLALMSAARSRPWDALSDRLSFFFTLSMDIQLLIGIVVWVMQSRWNSDLAIGYLHPLAMLAAVGLAHIGRVRAERMASDADKGKQTALFFIASLVVVLIAIPLSSWPV